MCNHVKSVTARRWRYPKGDGTKRPPSGDGVTARKGERWRFSPAFGDRILARGIAIEV
ncbi:hypothetical protein [Nostoc sp. CHAB 5715]|uniref:hypothetical protein n=1 Tax=Nostoc sp. CHAB 5715 TaxID=2780400 RepID=UPI001E6008C7|nr:hypothetical protein [Nostoc sp. CHAB 5715]MCC5626439.1 hypothetical protein [Nostoc sp. CHAB 5715]